MKGHKSTRQKDERGTLRGHPELVVPESRVYPKDHENHWMPRLRNRPNGKGWVSPTFQIRMKYLGEEAWFNLSSNKRASAGKARDIWLSLRAVGWEKTLGEYKPKAKKKINATVGEFLELIRIKAGLETVTFNIYSNKLRRIASGVKGLDDYGNLKVMEKGKSRTIKTKYQCVRGTGNAAWREKVESVKLRDLTSIAINAWKDDYIDVAKNNVALKSQRTRSVNSVLNTAKALFAPKHLETIEDYIELPDPLPFVKVKISSKRASRYRSQVKPELILTAASKQLKPEKPEQYIALLLGLGAGLSRKEIDLLEWSSILWDDSAIDIKETRYFKPKNEDKIGVIPVDTFLLDDLREYLPASNTRFVLNGNKPITKKAYGTYRCQKHFEGLTVWLREHGVDAPNPIHALRKEYGSLICQNFGIYVASRALRHSNIKTTAAHYLDQKDRATVCLGAIIDKGKLKAVKAS